MNERYSFYKEQPTNAIWRVLDGGILKGPVLFSFDKKKFSIKRCRFGEIFAMV